MSKKTRGLAANRRKAQREADLAKAEQRREKEKAVAAARRKQVVEEMRKNPRPKRMAKKKVLYFMQPVSPIPSRIRREDVQLDEHTRPRDDAPRYRLEGDPGWV